MQRFQIGPDGLKMRLRPLFQKGLLTIEPNANDARASVYKSNFEQARKLYEEWLLKTDPELADLKTKNPTLSKSKSIANERLSFGNSFLNGLESYDPKETKRRYLPKNKTPFEDHLWGRRAWHETFEAWFQSIRAFDWAYIGKELGQLPKDQFSS